MRYIIIAIAISLMSSGIMFRDVWSQTQEVPYYFVIDSRVEQGKGLISEEIMKMASKDTCEDHLRKISSRENILYARCISDDGRVRRYFDYAKTGEWYLVYRDNNNNQRVQLMKFENQNWKDSYKSGGLDERSALYQIADSLENPVVVIDEGPVKNNGTITENANTEIKIVSPEGVVKIYHSGY